MSFLVELWVLLHHVVKSAAPVWENGDSECAISKEIILKMNVNQVFKYRKCTYPGELHR